MPNFSTDLFFSPIIYFFHSLYIPITCPSLLSSETCLYKSLLPLPPPLLLREEEARLGYHSTLAHLVPAGLSSSSSTEAQPRSPAQPAVWLCVSEFVSIHCWSLSEEHYSRFLSASIQRIMNSVRGWHSHLEWVFSWASRWLAILSDFAPFLSLHLL